MLKYLYREIWCRCWGLESWTKYTHPMKNARKWQYFINIFNRRFILLEKANFEKFPRKKAITNWPSSMNAIFVHAYNLLKIIKHIDWNYKTYCRGYLHVYFEQQTSENTPKISDWLIFRWFAFFLTCVLFRFTFNFLNCVLKKNSVPDIFFECTICLNAKPLSSNACHIFHNTQKQTKQITRDL